MNEFHCKEKNSNALLTELNIFVIFIPKKNAWHNLL